VTGSGGQEPDTPAPRAGVRLVLASASPARLATLRQAGLSPEVIVSGVDEDAVRAADTAGLVAELAARKATAVAERIAAEDQGRDRETVVIGCDSLLELDGLPLGKPLSPDAAIQRWRAMRGRAGVLRTGHHLVVQGSGRTRIAGAVASTVVHFAEISDGEIEAYVATGEPLQVAGAFTVDGLGGPFVTGIEGDHHNVVGLSLPLLRVLLTGLGISWPSLWQPR
jgi:septum formation protein